MKLRGKIVLLLVGNGLCCGPVARARVTGHGAAERPAVVDKAKLLDRSILSVGTQMYSMVDCYALLTIWNVFAEKPIPITTNWPTFSGFPVARDCNLAGNIASWNKDAALVLFIAFVWEESNRLGLFLPTPKEIDAGIIKARAGLESPASSLPPGISEQLGLLPNSQLRGDVDRVLRAVSFERVRGDIGKNPSLVSQDWYWHESASRPRGDLKP